MTLHLYDQLAAIGPKIFLEISSHLEIGFVDRFYWPI